MRRTPDTRAGQSQVRLLPFTGHGAHDTDPGPRGHSPPRGLWRAGGDVDGAPSISGALRPQRLSRVDPRGLLPEAQARIVAGAPRIRGVQRQLAEAPGTSAQRRAVLSDLRAAVNDGGPYQTQVPRRHGRPEQPTSTLQQLSAAEGCRRFGCRAPSRSPDPQGVGGVKNFWGGRGK